MMRVEMMLLESFVIDSDNRLIWLEKIQFIYSLSFSIIVCQMWNILPDDDNIFERDARLRTSMVDWVHCCRGIRLIDCTWLFTVKSNMLLWFIADDDEAINQK